MIEVLDTIRRHLMTHDHETQPTASTASQQTGTVSTLSRRTLLKYASMSGLVGSTDVGAFSEIVSATEISDGSSSPDAPLRNADDCGQEFEKSLRVKGMGSGLNHYHLETSGDIIRRKGTEDQQEPISDAAVEGTIHKNDTDSYCYTGEVTTIWARGSIMYSVDDPTKK
jgi:hypothetical protein